jgi:hypothetical protein
MDGPFNNEIIYELPVKGSYALLIHENMMTGDPWKGNFTIEIHLTK